MLAEGLVLRPDVANARFEGSLVLSHEEFFEQKHIDIKLVAGQAFTLEILENQGYSYSMMPVEPPHYGRSLGALEAHRPVAFISMIATNEMAPFVLYPGPIVWGAWQRTRLVGPRTGEGRLSCKFRAAGR